MGLDSFNGRVVGWEFKASKIGKVGVASPIGKVKWLFLKVAWDLMVIIWIA